MCIEDAAVLSELLSGESVVTYKDVEDPFSVYDAVRNPRGEFLVRSSRFMGEAYEKRNEATGDDLDKITNECQAKNSFIHNVDVQQMCQDARAQLATFKK